MNIRKIVMTGRLYREMELLLKDKTDMDMRFIAESEVNEDILKWADAYVAFGPVPGFNFYDIKWVHCLGAGVDSFILNREWKRDVILTKTSGTFGIKISEYCLSYILSDIQYHDKFRQDKGLLKWDRLEPKTLDSQKVVIFGTGNIGQEIARNLSLLGVKPVGVSLSGRGKQYFERVVNIDGVYEHLKNADWVICTMPLTCNTFKLFGEDMFSYMWNTGFINVGRGAIVDEAALMSALDKDNVKKAVLDVFEAEPLSQQSKLWYHPQITITPHISAVTTADEAAAEFLSTLEALRNNGTHKNRVDIERGY